MGDEKGGLEMLRNCTVATVATLLVILAAGPALAQTPLQGLTPTPGAVEKAPVARAVEGTVTKVDPAARTVQVSTGFWGLFGRKLEVTGDTQIQSDGRQATLTELREGARVKASYENREGKNVATRIEVMPPPPQIAK